MYAAVLGSHALLRGQGRRRPLPEPWDAPTFILQREEAPVTSRSVGDIHHSFTTATSGEREHAAQQASSTIHQRYACRTLRTLCARSARSTRAP